MKRRLDRKAARKARIDPNQLGLFEAVSTPADVRIVPASSPLQPLRSAIARKTARHGNPAVLNARDAATYLGVSISTLKAWRRTAIGPPHTMLGARMVGYRIALLDAWLAARTTNPSQNRR